MALFRPQAARRQDTLHGEVNLVPPVGWQVIAAFLLISLALAATFLACASYARVAVVPGVVSADQGVIRVRPARTGSYDRILVKEGQTVRAGEVLAHVVLETSDEGASLELQRSTALERQKLAVISRLADTRQAGDDRDRALHAQLEGQRQQIVGAQAQLTEETQLLSSSVKDLESVQVLAQQGYLTQRDLRLREEQVANHKEAIARLRQQIDEHRTSIEVAGSDISRNANDTQGQLDALQAERADLERNAAGDDMQRGIDLRAPIAGVVTALTAHPGDPASPQQAILTILPNHSQIEAVLSAPPSAAGLLAPGQTVRIAIDAFPFETFGALSGVVQSLSETTAPAAGTGGGDAFLVHTTLQPSILAYGRLHPLRPGMTLTARVKTQPRSLMGWLFDPVLAVRRR